jgi:hypothetical protein
MTAAPDTAPVPPSTVPTGARVTDASGNLLWTGTVRWGQLRDSDAFVGAVTKRPQPNYAVAFELPVP